MRPVMRHARHALCVDADAPKERSRSWCLLCGDRSPESEDQDAARLWCLVHADEKRHTSFRSVVTRYYVAKSLADGD